MMISEMVLAGFIFFSIALHISTSFQDWILLHHPTLNMEELQFVWKWAGGFSLIMLLFRTFHLRPKWKQEE